MDEPVPVPGSTAVAYPLAAGPTPTRPVSPRQLAEALAAWPRLLLMLDYDGTLAPVSHDPQPPPLEAAAAATLADLAQRPGVKVAIVSGRRLADLRRLVPGLAIVRVGLHGGVARVPGEAERWFGDPARCAARLDPFLAAARTAGARVASGCEEASGRSGAWVEAKELGLALHIGSEEGVGVAGRVGQAWQTLAQRADMELVPGKGVLEVRPRGICKGRACLWLMQRWPDHIPVYVGDDCSDEDAFAAVRAGHPQAVIARVAGTELRCDLLGSEPSPAEGNEFGRLADWEFRTIPDVHAWIAGLAALRRVTDDG